MADLSLVLSPLTPADLGAIERLDEHAFGPGRFARSAYRLREGVEPLYALSFVARVGTLLVGANRMTPIRCSDAPALLLGPLTVDPAFRSAGIGEALVTRSLEAARGAGHRLVLLVGDMSYYGKLGFRPVPEGRLIFVGPVDPKRLLYCELVDGAFEGVKGRVRRHVI
jgi:predicted N-acetyltransferase YhbS